MLQVISFGENKRVYTITCKILNSTPQELMFAIGTHLGKFMQVVVWVHNTTTVVNH